MPHRILKGLTRDYGKTLLDALFDVRELRAGKQAFTSPSLNRVIAKVSFANTEPRTRAPQYLAHLCRVARVPRAASLEHQQIGFVRLLRNLRPALTPDTCNAHELRLADETLKEMLEDVLRHIGDGKTYT